MLRTGRSMLNSRRRIPETAAVGGVVGLLFRGPIHDHSRFSCGKYCIQKSR